MKKNVRTSSGKNNLLIPQARRNDGGEHKKMWEEKKKHARIHGPGNFFWAKDGVYMSD